MVNLKKWLFYFTAFGVVIHEFSHKKLCDHYNVPVDEVVYFQFDDPSGYVSHREPKGYTPNVMISLAPLFLNAIIALLFGFLIGVFYVDNGIVISDGWDVVFFILFAWIGISSGTHMFPSELDAKNILEQSKRNWYNPLVIFGVPTALFILLVSRVNRIEITFIVGIALLLIGVWVSHNIEILYAPADSVIKFVRNY